MVIIYDPGRGRRIYGRGYEIILVGSGGVKKLTIIGRGYEVSEDVDEKKIIIDF